MWKKTSFAKKWKWSKIKIWRMLQWNNCRQTPDVLSSIQGLRKLLRLTPSAFVLLQNINTQRFPGFSFSLFYILLFSVHIVNVNAAKSSTVLDNLRVNIYKEIYKVQVVI